MKIAFDIDGTLTDFGKFVLQNSSYICKKYHMEVTNPKGYDVENIFEIKKKCMDAGVSEEKAEERELQVWNAFWGRYYLKYISTKLRTGTKEVTKRLSDEGHRIWIISSRKKACEKTLIGKFVKWSTVFRLKMNGIKYEKIAFLENDEVKTDYILHNGVQVMVDDKPEIIRKLSGKIPCICIASAYNDVAYAENVKRVSGFEKDEVYSALEELEKYGGGRR